MYYTAKYEGGRTPVVANDTPKAPVVAQPQGPDAADTPTQQAPSTYAELRALDPVNAQFSRVLNESRKLEEEFKRKEDFHTYRVDITEQIKPTVGILTLEGIPVATEGNISAVVGEAKSKKTFLCTALIGGLLNRRGRAVLGSRPLPHTQVLWVDTEQSRTHVQLTARRIHTLAEIPIESNDEDFKMLALREIEPKMRAKMLFEAIHEWQPRVVVIDGISDLIYNTNDLEESELLITQLMRTSSRLKCHILVVLHTNPNSDKARGHIGSALLRKAETVIYVRKAESCSIAEPQFTRNEPFERFAFRINSEGLPEGCDLPQGSNSAYSDVVETVRALGGIEVARELVTQRLSEQRGCSRNTAKVRISRAVKQGLVSANEDGHLLTVR